MAISDAKREANKRYYRTKMFTASVQLSPVDADLIDFLKGKQNRSAYIRQLIREAYEREKAQTQETN